MNQVDRDDTRPLLSQAVLDEPTPVILSLAPDLLAIDLHFVFMVRSVRLAGRPSCRNESTADMVTLHRHSCYCVDMTGNQTCSRLLVQT